MCRNTHSASLEKEGLPRRSFAALLNQHRLEILQNLFRFVKLKLA